MSIARTTLIEVSVFIYSRFAGQISFEVDEFEFDLKRNILGRTSMHAKHVSFVFSIFWTLEPTITTCAVRYYVFAAVREF